MSSPLGSQAETALRFDRVKANRLAPIVAVLSWRFAGWAGRTPLRIDRDLVPGTACSILCPCALCAYSVSAFDSTVAFAADAFCRFFCRPINSSIRAWNRPERSARNASSGTCRTPIRSYSSKRI